MTPSVIWSGRYVGATVHPCTRNSLGFGYSGSEDWPGDRRLVQQEANVGSADEGRMPGKNGLRKPNPPKLSPGAMLSNCPERPPRAPNQSSPPSFTRNAIQLLGEIGPTGTCSRNCERFTLGKPGPCINRPVAGSVRNPVPRGADRSMENAAAPPLLSTGLATR